MQRLVRRLAAIVMVTVFMLCAAVPAFATESAQADLDIQLSAQVSSVAAGEEFTVEITVNNLSAEYPRISDLSFIINYDSADLDYSSFVSKPSTVKTSASAGAVIITFAAGSESECLGASTKWQLKFRAKNSFTSSVAQFSTERISACMRKSFSSVSTATSNVTHAFVAKKPFSSTGVVLTQANSNALLADITPLADGFEVDLVPQFSPGTTNYTVTIDYAVNAFSFRSIKAQDPKAQVNVRWPSDRLSVGTNNIEIVVTAADGITQLVYVVAVNRLSLEQSAAVATTFATVGTETAAPTTTTAATTTTTQTTTAATTTQTVAQYEELPVQNEGGFRLSAMAIVLGSLAVAVIAAVSFICGSIFKGARCRKTISDLNAKLQSAAAQNGALQKSVAQYGTQLRYMQQAAYNLASHQAEQTAQNAQKAPESAPEPEEGIQYSEEGVGEYVAGAKMLYDEYGNLIEYDRYGNVIHVEYDEYGNKLS